MELASIELATKLLIPVRFPSVNVATPSVSIFTLEILVYPDLLFELVGINEPLGNAYLSPLLVEPLLVIYVMK